MSTTLSVHCEDDMIIEDLRIHRSDTDNDPVPALWARPCSDDARQQPTIICLPGTNGDRHLLMEQAYGVSTDGVLHGWARELCRHGFATFAITHRCRPERGGDFFDWTKAEALYGRTAMGALVDDVRLCLDVLQQRPEVSARKLGVLGFSLGGITAFYAAIIDRRLVAAVTVCGGVGSLLALIDHGPMSYHSAYYFVPGLLQVGDHADLLTALAPRSLLVLGRTEDPGMPTDGVLRLAEAGQRVYEGAGQPQAFGVQVRPGGHRFAPGDLDAAMEWLARSQPLLPS